MKKIIGIIIFVILIFVSSLNVYAEDFDFTMNYTEQFSEWINSSDDIKENENMPTINSVKVPKDYFNKNTNEEKKGIWSFIKKIIGIGKNIESRYILNEHIDLEVKNQMKTSSCWAFSILSSMETNMALRKNDYRQFSERHMVYATSRRFIDEVNYNGFNKQAKDNGLHEIGLAYLTNGQGAVLEKDMPFENNEKPLYISEIDKRMDTYVTGYERLPSIYKIINSDKSITYHDGMGSFYSEDDVEAIRNHIKQTIKEYGGISAVTMSGETDYYNTSNPLKSTAYFCDDNNAIRDHGFTIIGWDDKYKKENFYEKHRPASDGAYIVLNSYGKEAFNNGIFYVSYEDVLIETSLYAIKDTSDEEYNNLYQHDFFGGAAYIGSDSISTGYYANIYERDSSEIELLDYVGVTVLDYVKLNIFVNPVDDSLKEKDLIKVASTDTLNPGYYKIKIDPIQLTSDKFTIVIEQISENGRFYLTVEPNLPNTPFDIVESERGNSKVSLNGNTWYDLSYFEISDSILDIEKSDVCIKGFTKKVEKEEKYFESEKYHIDEEYIKNVEVSTTVKEFLRNIITNQQVEIFNEDKLLTDSDKLKTGMELKVGDKTFKIVVIGDINADGKLSLLDISKLIYHYNEDEKYLLKDEFKQAGDLNSDGKISIIDISKLIILYNQI